VESLAGADQLHDALHHLMQGEPGRVDVHGVVESRWSRSAISFATCSGVSSAVFDSARRRRLRSSSDAVKKTFTSAFGKTTVPMSRPSMTELARLPSSRCRATRASRTAECALTCEAASETALVRISSVTSWPSR
jgi:hypothetical protein